MDEKEEKREEENERGIKRRPTFKTLIYSQFPYQTGGLDLRFGGEKIE